MGRTVQIVDKRRADEEEPETEHECPFDVCGLYEATLDPKWQIGQTGAMCIVSDKVMAHLRAHINRPKRARIQDGPAVGGAVAEEAVGGAAAEGAVGGAAVEVVESAPVLSPVVVSQEMKDKMAFEVKRATMSVLMSSSLDSFPTREDEGFAAFKAMFMENVNAVFAGIEECRNRDQ